MISFLIQGCPGSVARVRMSQELRDQCRQVLGPRKISFAQSPLCLCNPKKSKKNGYRKGRCLFCLGLLHPWARKDGQAEQRIRSGNISEHGFAKAEASSGYRQSQQRNGSPSTLHTSFSSMQILCGPPPPSARLVSTEQVHLPSHCL